MQNWNNLYKKIKNKTSTLVAKIGLFLTSFLKKFIAAFNKKFFEILVGLAVAFIAAILLNLGGADKLIAYWEAKKSNKINFVDRQIRGQFFDSATDELLSNVFIGIVGESDYSTHTDTSGLFTLEFRAHKDSTKLQLTFVLEGYKTAKIHHIIPLNDYAKNKVQHFTLQAETDSLFDLTYQ